MKLVGFKSRSTLKVYQNLRPSYFIYPDEIVMKGSSQTFHAMIKSLVKKDKYALVRFVPRECATMRFCALLPQEESIPNNPNEQYLPPGFHCIFLPFAEDSRSVEESLSMVERVPKPEKEETRTAKLFIKNMTIDFDSRKFENPSIQRFYSGLQSFALNEEKPEEIQDTLEPDYEGMDKMIKVIDQMKDTFSLGYIQKEARSKPKGGKRKREENEPQEDNSQDIDCDLAANNNKRVKVDEQNEEQKEEKPEIHQEEAEMTDNRLREFLSEEKLSQFSVKQLKQMCSDREVQTKASTKKGLIAELQNYIDSLMKD